MKIIFTFLVSFALVLMGCNPKSGDIKEIDFQKTTPLELLSSNDSTSKTLRVAVSAILSPKETYKSYEEVFRYISNKLGMKIEFHQRKTYKEVNQMLEERQLDFAFICSGAYIELSPEDGVELLCVPISNGKPLYQAYIIVPESSRANQLSELRNSSFAFTDPLSNTGYLYALYRLKKIGYDPNNFFSSTLFTNGHDISIQMVAKGLVDGATIDGLVYDYLKVKEPERVENVRVIEKSDYYGIPPVVISSHLDDELKERITDIFLNMHKDENARALINGLLIDRFELGDDKSYNSIREMRRNVMGN